MDTYGGDGSFQEGKHPAIEQFKSITQKMSKRLNIGLRRVNAQQCVATLQVQSK